MQGTEYQMAGESSLDGHHGRFGIADFADHDYVWILPQNAAETACEGHPFLEIDLSLRDAFKLIFDWIFQSNGVSLTGVQFLQRRVKRCALATAG